MKLIECHIENFGKLSDFKHSFSDGLNVINRENGYGKTTLSVFIKAMFFGLDESRKLKIEENDRKKYLPWNGMRCAGSLIFEVSGKRYRIERSFMPKAAEDTFKLYDVKSNKETDDYTKNIGEELFGIDADGFERTVFLSEANLSGRTDNKKIASKLSDLVGCEGDIGVMDDAVELLEKQRKAYHRKGGAGIIGDVRERLTDIELKINDLTRMKKSLADEEEKLSAISAELNGYKEERKKLVIAARDAEIARSKRAYEKQYREMRDSLNSDLESFEKLRGFFKNGVPTTEELETMRELSSEARRINESYEIANGSKEQEYQYIDNKLTGNDYETAKLASEKIKSLEHERNIVREKLYALTENTSTIPSAEEAEKHIAALSNIKNSKKVNKSWHFLLPASVILVIFGIVLTLKINTAFIAVSVIGLMLFFISVFKISKHISADDGYEIKEAYEFTEKYTKTNATNKAELLPLLYEIRAEAKSKVSEKETLLTHITEIEEEISGARRVACEFLSHFPTVNAPTVTEAVDIILQKHAIQSALFSATRQNEERRREELIKAKECSDAVTLFLSRYPTSTSRPFDEINSKIIEYNTRGHTITRMRESIQAFVNEHGINTESSTEDTSFTEYIPNPDDPTLLAKIAELERSKTLIERQCTAYADELDRIDSLYAERDEYTEKLEKYLRLFEINQKTQRFLNEAKDSLTARYLSKTKAAFDKYMTAIADEDGDTFEMDTSFGVSKNEKGTLRGTAAYSRGTRDAQFLATRLALIDSLYENEKPFIILDDPFAYLDNAKLSRALRALTKLGKEKQIIYFTCQSSREP